MTIIDILLSYGYRHVAIETYELADAAEFTACLDRRGAVSFWHKEQLPDRLNITRLFGFESDVEKIREWLSTNSPKTVPVISSTGTY